MTPYQKAREAFDSYCAKDNPEGLNPAQALQWHLNHWAQTMFGDKSSASNDAHGMAEEIGETNEVLVDIIEHALLGLRGSAAIGRVNHAFLKSEQKIRGLHDRDKAREAMADGVADQAVYAINFCTKNRIDYWTLVFETAKQVMKRDWISDRQSGAA